MQSKTKSTLILLLVLIIGFILGSVTSGALQNRRSEKFRDMSPERRFRHAIENIVDPTSEQKEQLRIIFDEHAQKMAEIQEEKASELLTVVDSLRISLNSVLTEDQIKRFHEHMDQARNRFFTRHLNRIKQTINLTNEQEEQIKDILENHKKSLPDDLMTGGLGPKPEMMDMLRKLDQEIETILTPEQVKKYREHKMTRGRRSGDHFFKDQKRYMDRDRQPRRFKKEN